VAASSGVSGSIRAPWRDLGATVAPLTITRRTCRRGAGPSRTRSLERRPIASEIRSPVAASSSNRPLHWDLVEQRTSSARVRKRRSCVDVHSERSASLKAARGMHLVDPARIERLRGRSRPVTRNPALDRDLALTRRGRFEPAWTLLALGFLLVAHDWLVVARRLRRRPLTRPRGRADVYVAGHAHGLRRNTRAHRYVVDAERADGYGPSAVLPIPRRHGI
jgi:hypothetical protein